VRVLGDGEIVKGKSKRRGTGRGQVKGKGGKSWELENIGLRIIGKEWWGARKLTC